MRIKSFTLSPVQTRCKFLLFAAMIFMLYAPKSQAQIQNFFHEGFDLPLFPPAGWDTSSNVVSYPVPTGTHADYTGWYATNGVGNVNVPLAGSFTQITSGATPYAGSAGMAWVDFHNDSVGTSALLTTPPLNFSSLTSIGGQYTLSFYVYCSYFSGDTNVIKVYINSSSPSTTGPNATLLASLHPNNGTLGSGWVKCTYTLSQTLNPSTNAYVMFQAIDSMGVGSYPDGYIDQVSIDFTPPCTGKPSGTVNHVTPCYNKPFTFSYNDTNYTNLTYKWYRSSDSLGRTPNVYSLVGTSSSLLQTNTLNEYYILVVHCGISNTDDTIRMNAILAPFYLCYCTDTTSNGTSINIGNVTMATYYGHTTALNNGNASPTVNNTAATHVYTSYDYLTPAVLYKDSLYAEFVTAITTSGSIPGSYKAYIFIDYNQNGVFDANELINPGGGAIPSTANPYYADTFHLSPTALYGITGMRVILTSSTYTDACGPYNNGETEDYLVNIVHDQCNSTPHAGVAYISDSSMCRGYTYTIVDTTHDLGLYGLEYNWQTSPDNGHTWGSMPYVLNQDKLSLIFQSPASYRLAMICVPAHDTTYSDTVTIVGEPNYACYCVSQATGGVNDSTDLGYFRLGKYVYTKNNLSNNGHLNNPDATHGRTDYTAHVMDLGIDSTYSFLLYQIMRYNNHSDARISIFIDYNNNGVYNIPDDSVLTLYTTPDSFFVANTLTIQPHYYTVPNVLTGMRIVINSDTDDNVASHDGCGSYTSGETIDFVVKLHDSTTAGINRIANLSDVAMFPNPSTGKFKVMFNAAAQVNNMELNVTNITGQRVYVKNYSNVGTSFSESIDLSGQPRGMYFVEFIVDGARMIKKLTID